MPKFDVPVKSVEGFGGGIPPGIYDAKCEEVEERISNAGNPLWVAHFRIIGGPYDGMKVRENLNIGHPNESAARIALRTAGNIGAACGLEETGDTDDWIGIPIRIEVIEDGSYTRIKAFMAAGKEAPKKPQATPPPNGGGKSASAPPWKS